MMKDTALVRTLYQWAERHQGVVTRQQALNLGADDRIIVHLVGPALRRSLRDLGHIGAPQPSVLESRMARVFLRYRLPVPRAEVVWGDQRQYRLDFAYPAIRLAIEVYGYAWHHSPQQLDHDLARERHLQRAGWTVLAYTWRQIMDDPEGVAAEIDGLYRRLSTGA
jgi:hypothetical protein